MFLLWAGGTNDPLNLIRKRRTRSFQGDESSFLFRYGISFPATLSGWGAGPAGLAGVAGGEQEGAAPPSSEAVRVASSTRTLPWAGAPTTGEGQGGVLSQGVTRLACLAWVGCRGPRRPAAALSAQLVFGKAPAGVQDGGERVGSQALCTRRSPLHPRHGGGGRQSRGLLGSRALPCSRPCIG